MIYHFNEKGGFNMTSWLEKERIKFKSTLPTYTDYNLVTLMSLHNASNSKNKTAQWVELYGVQYGKMVYEECLEELFNRKSELLKEVLV